MFPSVHGVVSQVGAVGDVLPGDLVPGAAAVYSLRRWREAYVGAAVRVRRSSDNAEQDIGFAGNDFDDATFSSFIGAGSGFVRTWYDQSENTHHAQQATTANQPQVVLSAVNGRAVLRLDGVNDNLVATRATSSGMTALAVVRQAAVKTSAGNAILSTRSTQTYYEVLLGNSGAPDSSRAVFQINDGAFRVHREGLPGTAYVVVSAVFDGPGSAISGGINGSLTTLSLASAYTLSGTSALTIGALGGGVAGYFMNGDIPEIAIYESAIGAGDRGAIEVNQADYYGITL